MKRSSKKIALIAGLTALCATGGSLAYFTDTHETTNKFRVGSIKVSLTETGWDTTDTNGNNIPDAAENVVPTQVIAKNPVITNVEKNDAWVYIEVNIPMANIITTDDAGHQLPQQKTELWSFNKTSGAAVTGFSGADASKKSTFSNEWMQMKRTEAADESSVTYLFGRKEPLKGTGTDESKIKGEVADSLFDTIRFCNARENQTLEHTDPNVKVVAHALQTENTGADAAAAWDKYSTQASTVVTK